MGSFDLGSCGVFLNAWNRQAPTPQGVVDLAQEAERLGFDSLNMGWHATLPPGGPFTTFDNQVLLDPFVMLPVIAARTERLRVGLNSTVLPAQHPFTLAQYFAAMDNVFEGRCIAGGAIGWWQHDLQLSGARTSERGARADEALAVITDLWAGRAIEEPGRFWDATGLAVGLRPRTDPMPLWVGGGPVAVPRAARWGTALMPLNLTPQYIKSELRPRLDDEAARHGRRVDIALMTYSAVYDDAGSVEKRVEPLLGQFGVAEHVEAGRPEATMVAGTVEQCVDQLGAYVDAGVDYVVFDTSFHGLEDGEFVKDQWARLAADVVPAVS